MEELELAVSGGISWSKEVESVLICGSCNCGSCSSSGEETETEIETEEEEEEEGTLLDFGDLLIVVDLFVRAPPSGELSTGLL